MKLKSALSTLIFFACMNTYAAPTNASSCAPVASGTLTFATEATYPPFESMDKTGQLQGFDIDVANAICTQLKSKCVFLNQPFDSLIPSLKLGKFDAIIAAMGITPEREKVVNFTQPYYKNPVSFVVPINVTEASFNTAPNQLIGKTIGVQKGTTFEKYLNAIYPRVVVKTYASEESAFLDLSAGRIDAVMGDTPLVVLFLKEHGNGAFHLIGKPIEDEKYFGTGNGIAINKNNANTLLPQLNCAITVLKQNGTMKQLETKYFSDKPTDQKPTKAS